PGEAGPRRPGRPADPRGEGFPGSPSVPLTRPDPESLMRCPLLACVLCLVAGPALPADEPPFDLLLRNGRVIDGTGNPWYHGDVAIRGDRIVAVGKRLRGQARRVI